MLLFQIEESIFNNVPSWLIQFKTSQLLRVILARLRRIKHIRILGILQCWLNTRRGNWSWASNSKSTRANQCLTKICQRFFSELLIAVLSASTVDIRGRDREMINCREKEKEKVSMRFTSSEASQGEEVWSWSKTINQLTASKIFVTLERKQKHSTLMNPPNWKLRRFEAGKNHANTLETGGWKQTRTAATRILKKLGFIVWGNLNYPNWISNLHQFESLAMENINFEDIKKLTAKINK